MHSPQLFDLIHLILQLDSIYSIKKPEPNDSGFPCSEEYRIIEPDLGGVGGIRTICEPL